MKIAYKSVEEALKDMQAKTNANGKVLINKFNKKKFNALMITMLNDPDFTERIAKERGGVLEHEDIMVSKGFRKWCKHLLERAGMDKMESDKVLSADFRFDNVDGLYDFFASALYQYISAGNRFDLPTKDDFMGSIEMHDVAESKKTGTARSPQTGEILGEYETKTKKHRVVKAKSKCPKWLTEKRMK